MKFERRELTRKIIQPKGQIMRDDSNMLKNREDFREQVRHSKETTARILFVSVRPVVRSTNLNYANLLNT